MSGTPQPGDFTGRGYVVFLPYGQGTKSESWRPFAVLQNGETMRLHVQGDNPFSDERLKPYHRLCCEFSGQFDARSKVLLVSSISEVSDPFAGTGTDEQAPSAEEGSP